MKHHKADQYRAGRNDQYVMEESRLGCRAAMGKLSLHVLVFPGVRVLAKGIHCVRHKLLDGGL